MPLRTTPLVTGEFYHIFNRGVNKQPIFLGIREYQRALDVLDYYSFETLPLRFSKFLLLSHELRNNLLESLHKDNKKLVDIVSFCFMPNHFHLLLQQLVDNGISRFMSDFQNSYTRYFNTKNNRIGPLLQGQFKTVRIEDDYQLLHVSRYIHLNPYSSFVVKNIQDLLSYKWSSFPEYVNVPRNSICNREIIFSNFKKGSYQNFVFDQADYQRKLEQIKHLTLEQ